MKDNKMFIVFVVLLIVVILILGYWALKPLTTESPLPVGSTGATAVTAPMGSTGSTGPVQSVSVEVTREVTKEATPGVSLRIE